MATKQKKNDPIFRLGDLPGQLTEQGRNVWLAGLGAFATVEEEGSRFFNDLVQRGEKMEKRGKEQIDATVDSTVKEIQTRQKQATDTVGGAAGRVEDIVSRTVKTVLDRFDVPTRKEVQSLAAKVADLSEKIDRLAVTLEKKTAQPRSATAARSTYHVVPREEGWAVMKEGAERATSVHDTKKEAVESGRELAKGKAPSELVVHKQDGTIQETLSYDGEE